MKDPKPCPCLTATCDQGNHNVDLQGLLKQISDRRKERDAYREIAICAWIDEEFLDRVNHQGVFNKNTIEKMAEEEVDKTFRNSLVKDKYFEADK